MPVLKNAKHEHFAQLCAKGEKPAKAYTSAGYSDKGADQSASRLLKTAQISSRVAELKEAIVERTIEKAAVDRTYVISNLQEVVNRCMQTAPVLDMFGKPVLIPLKDGKTLAAAFTFNPNPAVKALMGLADIEGMVVKRVETGEPGAFGLPRKPDEAKELIDRIRSERSLRASTPAIPIKTP
jgi:hypothetical protein